MSNWNRSSDSLVRCPRGFAVVALLALPILLAAFGAAPARAQNAIVLENQLTGNPASEWDVDGAGDLTIQGFATDISVNRGETVHFKIKTDAAAYHIDIYRLGYYQGNGARHVGTGVVTATLPQTQPADLTDATTGLTDCGNWSESAHWDVPANAVSGIYIAKLTRDDTQRREPHRVHRARRREPLGPPVPDLRRDVAGLQRVRRQQPLRRRRTARRR